MYEAKVSVHCDSSRCRSSQTSAGKSNLQSATVPRQQMTGTLSSLVAMLDDHVVDDVTAASVDVNKPPPSESRDTYFRSPCEVCVTKQSQRPTGSYRLGDETVNKMAREHLVNALRDCHLTSYDQFPFPVVNGTAAGDVSANKQRHYDVMTSGDCLRRRNRTMRNVEQRVSESSDADSSIVCSDSVTSDDTSKSFTGHAKSRFYMHESYYSRNSSHRSCIHRFI